MKIKEIQKKAYTNQIIETINNNELVLFYHYNKIEHVNSLKNDLKEAIIKTNETQLINNLKLRLIKNNLTTKIIDKTKWANLSLLCQGPTFIIYSTDSNKSYEIISNVLSKKPLYTNNIIFLGGKIKNGLVSSNQLKKTQKNMLNNQAHLELLSELNPLNFNLQINNIYNTFLQTLNPNFYLNQIKQ